MKKTSKIIISLISFFVIIILVIPQGALAAILHTILVANTEDKGIGCEYDHKNMILLVNNISKNTGMKLKLMEFKDKNWSRSKIIAAVKNLTAGKDDMVIFYYSGHGYRMESKKNKWPSMALQNDEGLDLFWVYKTIGAKKPRFFIVMSDSCNNKIPDGAIHTVRSTSYRRPLELSYIKLFLKSRGSIIASGSKPGQFSFGGPPSGGIYTCAFRQSLEMALKTPDPEWLRIMKEANKPLASGKQEPQFEMNVKIPEDSSDSGNEEIEDDSSEDYETVTDDLEGCRQMAETAYTLKTAYKTLNSEGKLKKISKAYGDLMYFFSWQIEVSHNEGFKDTENEFRKYVRYMEKGEWNKLKKIVKVFSSDFNRYLKEDCPGILKDSSKGKSAGDPDSDICREISRVKKLIFDAMVSINNKGSIRKNHRIGKSLNFFFKEQLQISREEKDKRSIREFKRYLNYLNKKKWGRLDKALRILYMDYDLIYADECEK